jgi:hypothetical protein
MRACCIVDPKHVKAVDMTLHGWVCTEEFSRYIMNGM